MRFLWVYEAFVILIVSGAGLNIALTGGGSIPMAAPLILIACAEALRIPLSAAATRLRWPGRLLAGVALLAIAVGSAEGLAVAFEAFLQNRVVEIMRAAGDVDRAQQIVDQAAVERSRQDAEIAALTAQVTQLDSAIAALSKNMPTPPAGSNRTCTWRGQRVTCSADAAAANAYRKAQEAYDARMASLTGQRGDFQAKVDAARANQPPAVSPEASKALLEAKTTFREKAGQSPAWRLTAAVFGEDVSSVTPAQFGTVKKFVTATLAITFATLSMAVSVVAHLQPNGHQPSKLSRATRAWLARRRRPVYRSVPGPTQYRDRFIHVPVDPVSGRPLGPDTPR